MSDPSVSKLPADDLAHYCDLLEARGTGFWRYEHDIDRLTLSGGVPAALPNQPLSLRGFYRILHREDCREVSLRLSQAAAGSGDFRLECRVRGARRHWRWLEIRGRVTERGGAGRPGCSLGICCDITDRRVLEADLADSEERLQLVTDTITEVLWIAGVEPGTLHYVSPAYERIWRRPVSELYANPRSLLASVHPDDLGLVLARLERKKDGLPLDYEYRIVRPDGSIRWIWDRGFPVQELSGPIRRYVGVARDVTERKSMEVSLRASEERFRLFMDHTPAAAWIKDSEGRMVYVNRSFETIFRRPREDWLGRTDAELWPPEVARQNWENDRLALEAGTAREMVEVIPAPDGSPRYWRAFKFPMAGPGGDSFVGGVAIDITEQRRAEQESQALNAELEARVARRTAELEAALKELNRSEQRLSQALDRLTLAQQSAGAGTWTWDLRTGELEWSPELFRMFGLDPDSAASIETWRAALLAEDAAETEARLMAAVRDREQLTVEYRIVRPDGKVRWLQCSSRPRCGPGGEPLEQVGITLDVTEAKRAEAELAEKEQRWLLALESHDMGVWDWNVRSGRTVYSARLLTMLGYEDGAWGDDIGEWKQRVHPGDLPGVLAALENYFAGSAPRFEAEYRLCCRGGGYRWILDVGKLIERTPDGKPLRMVGTHTDIEDRKRAEDINERLAAIIEASSDLIATGQPSGGRITYINRAGRAMLGIDPEASLEHARVDDFYPPEAWAMLRREAIPAAIREGRWMGDNALLRCDGSELPVSQLLIVHRDPGTGKVAFLSTICRDISGRQEAERLLRESEERFRLIADSAPALIWMADPDRGRSFSSQVWLEFTGRGAVDELGCGWAAGVHPDDLERYFDVYNRAFEARAVYEVEYRLRRHDGSFRWLLEKGRPRYDVGRRFAGYIGSCVDITERVQGEADLAAAKRAAEAANLAKSRFLANMSHEIRTPMNGILGLANLLRRGEASPVQAGQLDRIEAAGRHLLCIIDDILDLSKIEAGRMAMHEESFGPAELLVALGGFGENAAAKGLAFEVDLDDLPMHLIGDATRLRQILTNFLGNALKFTETGSIRLAGRMLREWDSGCLLRFEVADTGPGLTAGQTALLFEPFAQVDDSPTRRRGGTGLGLAIARRLARLMGGEVGVESTPGEGSIFWVEVRLRKGAAPLSATARPEGSEPAEAVLRSKHRGAPVLLAEDDPINQEVALMLLEEAGLAPDLANNGLEAVTLAEARDYRLILMDIQMPEMDGIEAARRLREGSRARETPIVALTANVFSEDRALCVAAGMNDFLAKPVEPQRFFEVILAWLDRGGVG
jgi:PAS domain S-box-containing protein